MTTLLALALVLAAFIVALSALLVFGVADRRRAGDRLGRERGDISFLFENETLLDATHAAREMLASTPARGSDWARLSGLLEPRFPGLGDWIGDLADLGRIERTSDDGTSLLSAEWHGGAARIALTAAGAGGPGAPDRYTLAATTREAETLRAATDHTPCPMWQEDGAGTILWCNRTYLDLAEPGEAAQGWTGWPPARLFDIPAPPAQSDDAPDAPPARAALPTATGRRWFTIDRQPLGDGQLCTALPADALIRAETTLNEFVTTLSKTFASLSIGLAIFGRDRELAMFNPALLDLTTLPVDFLIARPTLAAFLDRLRALQMIPEPKDYKSWRDRVSDLATEARNGTFEETWTLPGGQTYRVSGQPHPDGAIAFLFEDISDEIGLTRRFHAEIETARAVLDTLPQAIAVFSPAGVLTLRNAAYGALWGEGTGAGVLGEALALWRAAALPGTVWDDIRAALGRGGARDTHETQLTLRDGRALACRTAPLPHGFTMVDFTPLRTAPTRGSAAGSDAGAGS